MGLRIRMTGQLCAREKREREREGERDRERGQLRVREIRRKRSNGVVGFRVGRGEG